MTDLPDLTTLDDETLATWQTAVATEVGRREVLADAEPRAEQITAEAQRQLDEVALDFLTARDGPVDEADPPSWVMPTGAHDAYPAGVVRAHIGKIWRSRVSGNSHEPGADHGHAWLEVVPQPDTGGHTPWSPGQAVEVGDLRAHDGRLWEARLDHITHVGWAPSPAAYAVWTDLGPLETPNPL